MVIICVNNYGDCYRVNVTLLLFSRNKIGKTAQFKPEFKPINPIKVIFPLFWPQLVNDQTFLITLSLLLPSIMLMTPFDLC